MRVIARHEAVKGHEREREGEFLRYRHDGGHEKRRGGKSGRAQPSCVREMIEMMGRKNHLEV